MEPQVILDQEPTTLNAQTDKIVLYGHETCPLIPPVWLMLKQSRVPFDYINIRTDEAGRAHVRTINNGYESVPTLVFPDGSTLTEPSEGTLRAKLRSLGYEVPLLARLAGLAPQLILGAVILFAALRMLGVI
ncbi:MAG: hypothetical protein GYB67_13775 [Chloroflexi bacterium]|nr:hypothetical protein [Chloroflexota bacterium]